MLTGPSRVMVARAPEDVLALVEEVEAEQRAGRYVAGYLSYEAGAVFGLKVREPVPGLLPLAWMAAYEPDSATVIPPAQWKELLSRVDVSRAAGALAGVLPELSVSRDEYVDAIRRVREYIAAGDTYQVNYTVRGRFALAGAERAGAGTEDADTEDAIDPFDYFLALVVRQQVPYAAYFDLGEAQVVSLSPEMFLRRERGRLESRPMKGTRPRGATHPEDVALAYELAETEKERAENLMIVDMVRNDLGRVCRAGSVRVPALYTVEPYRTVWQMTSTVIGDVNPRASLWDIMRAVYPGASITGAPKHHTMEIIAELETEPRDVYCGAVSLFMPGGDFTCNIAIRTIVHQQSRCKLGTGSGVVWDAAAAAEYDETLVKASFATPPAGDTWRPDPETRLSRAMRAAEGFQLFETILLDPREGDATVEAPLELAGLSPSLAMSDTAVLARYRFLDEHLDRMAGSAEALGLRFDRQTALALLVGCARLNPGAQVVHLDLEAEVGFSISTRAAPGIERAPVALMVSPFRTDPDDPFLRHKTSVRGFYNREHRRAVHEGCFDALFLNGLDRVTEGSIVNVFARFGRSWVTPPLCDGLLPGVWRARYLAETGAAERSLTLEELLAADLVVVGNSVRGALTVDRVVADPVVF
ncbi:MAG: aminodeoxychorismate synthase component I [Thermoleophilia bacterium]|nr:aminodeoxychorismate synthase component I [Thermoleophilia bacterium]